MEPEELSLRHIGIYRLTKTGSGSVDYDSKLITDERAPGTIRDEERLIWRCSFNPPLIIGKWGNATGRVDDAILRLDGGELREGDLEGELTQDLIGYTTAESFIDPDEEEPVAVPGQDDDELLEMQ